MRTYMIIENYKSGRTQEIYKRYSEKGRMLPDGVQYIDSWVEENMEKCYQIMMSVSEDKLLEWIDQWKDLVDFEIIPVLNTEEANRQINL